MKAKSGERTLLMSVLMSSPGPIVVGIGLFLGRSSTQVADFVRRTAELVAIIVSYAIYRTIHKKEAFDQAKKARLERGANIGVGAAMVISGAVMILIALISENSEAGNVIPGLSIALLGVIANTIFFFKYTSMNRKSPDAILKTQSRLYGAKALVDISVVTALIVVAVLPETTVAFYVDKVGSVIVAAYLIFTGTVTVLGKKAGTNPEKHK